MNIQIHDAKTRERLLAKGIVRLPQKTERKLEMSQEKMDRFKRVAGMRTTRALRSIELIGNCAAKSSYQYKDSGAKDVFSL